MTHSLLIFRFLSDDGMVITILFETKKFQYTFIHASNNKQQQKTH